MDATIRKFKSADFDRLVAMYVAFEPKGAFNRLPPQSEAEIKRWLSRLREMEFDQFVIEVTTRIVGHAALCAFHTKSEAELAIFVHQDYRRLGLGKKLLLGVLNYACKTLQLQSVWLMTQGSNAHALRLFESLGFHSTGEEDPLSWELEMERPLHCLECKGDLCAIYGQSLPRIVRLPKMKSKAA